MSPPGSGVTSYFMSLERSVTLPLFKSQFSNRNVHSRLYLSTTSRLSTTGTRVSSGTTQFYLPPGRDDVPVITPAEVGTRFINPREWVDWSKWLMWISCLRIFRHDQYTTVGLEPGRLGSPGYKPSAPTTAPVVFRNASVSEFGINFVCIFVNSYQDQNCSEKLTWWVT